MKLVVDVHCHLDLCEDIPAVVKRAQDAGISTIITNGTNAESNKKSLELAKTYDIVNAALGIYPLEGLQLTEHQFDDILKEIEKHRNSIVAIGEVGIDYHMIKDKNDQQKKNFEKIIHLAEKLKKPMLVHSRKAESDTIDLLESSNAKKVVMHCFGGNMKLVKRADDLSFFFSIPTNIVSLLHFQEIVQRVELGKLLTETDAPWLSPFKDRKNESAFVVESIKKIADLKKMTPEEVVNAIYMNYQRMFC